MGFIGDPLEGIGPKKSFKPLEINPEDIRDSDLPDEVKEHRENTINRWRSQQRFNYDDNERRGIAEAQTKPPFAG